MVMNGNNKLTEFIKSRWENIVNNKSTVTLKKLTKTLTKKKIHKITSATEKIYIWHKVVLLDRNLIHSIYKLTKYEVRIKSEIS